ncbi:MAG: Sec-independent protein translocase protein TatB [Sphingopyxis sp.]
MFDVAPTELLLVVVVALVVIGPKDLPKAMRFVGKWMGKARGMARHFRAGLDTMMREAELEELEKQWREQNEAIMREFPRIEDADSVAAAKPATPAPTASNADRARKKDGAPDSAEDAGSAETHVVPPKDGPLP